MSDKYDPWKYLKDECEFMAKWVAKQGCALTLEGEVGFGRPAVGVMKLDHYPDWRGYEGDWYDLDAPVVDAWWQVEEAHPPPNVDYYHKHDCLAVLGHTHESVEQLYKWVEKLSDNGIIVASIARKPRDMVDAVVHGHQQHVLTTQEKLNSRE